MQNIIILGSGRSGTSLASGLFAKSGFFMVDNSWDSRESNPKGFFEDEEVNEINEDILQPLVPKRLKFLGITIFKNRPLKWERWLSEVALDAKIKSIPSIEKRIEKLTSRKPFCFKDPRFSYTLEVWRPFLEDTIYICVFRNPMKTVNSMIKECIDTSKLKIPNREIIINIKQGFRIWSLMYKHILNKHSKVGTWIFLHYNQLFDVKVLRNLGNITGANIDYSFPDKAFNRSRKLDTMPQSVSDIYNELCSRANYKDNENSIV